ncbi:hypothetical protein ACI48D_09670 [Massilia sp. LXY-6]|uniref:hypothetical protein n=1 Tax=Massilia sp. LXY-6 TaxID=3379823 RepID=UPI003EE0D7D0
MNGSGFSRRHLWMAIVLAAASAAPLLADAGPGNGNGKNAGTSLDDGDSRVQRGREIVPPGVVLNLQGKQRGMVWLGSYIVNTSGCVDCHTHPSYSPGGDPFKGQPERINAEQYMSGGRMFGPAITAANLTPDNAGRPAGLTRDEFVQTLRTGHNPHDPAGQILQVMPWPTFGKMTTRDLYAVYEYLRAIPSLPDNPKPGP